MLKDATKKKKTEKQIGRIYEGGGETDKKSYRHNKDDRARTEPPPERSNSVRARGKSPVRRGNKCMHEIKVLRGMKKRKSRAVRLSRILFPRLPICLSFSLSLFGLLFFFLLSASWLFLWHDSAFATGPRRWDASYPSITRSSSLLCYLEEKASPPHQPPSLFFYSNCLPPFSLSLSLSLFLGFALFFPSFSSVLISQ